MAAPAEAGPVHPAHAPPAADVMSGDVVSGDVVSGDVRRRAGGVFAGLGAVLAASVLLPPPGPDGRIGHVPAFCPFYLLTGLPCPGCGLTRAFVCLAHGQWRASLHWHPAGWLVYAVCILLWLRAGVTLARGTPFLPAGPPMSGRLSAAGAAGLLLVGAARVGWLVAHHGHF